VIPPLFQNNVFYRCFLWCSKRRDLR
jgi:hypothetical protein